MSASFYVDAGTTSSTTSYFMLLSCALQMPFCNMLLYEISQISFSREKGDQQVLKLKLL